MSAIILNIGAGYLPLVASDFSGVDEVINFDPLLGDPTTTTALNVNLMAIVARSPDITYFTTQDKVDEKVADGSVDLILGVSPYNLSLVSDWADRKLKKRIGYVACLSNARNDCGDAPSCQQAVGCSAPSHCTTRARSLRSPRPPMPSSFHPQPCKRHQRPNSTSNALAHQAPRSHQARHARGKKSLTPPRLVPIMFPNHKGQVRKAEPE
ncbi:MAG TPA: hypothetical protein VMB71_00750 [Acetobacteraceae bacterium]|nr:hypothetical protein [Acetobacteraceae bacterium]